jgi:ribonuclease T1
VALVLLALVLGHGAFSGGSAGSSSTPTSHVPVVAASLPAEARQTLALIDSGGPFPYDQDGVVFENREGLLPDHDTGYYHEYTVPTPGSPDRGARRIITGSAGELYYTGDHYRSFERISP